MDSLQVIVQPVTAVPTLGDPIIPDPTGREHDFETTALTTTGIHTSIAGPFHQDTLLAVGVPLPAAPEPASWGLMIAGLGAIGVAMHRRKAAVSFA